MRKWQAIAVAGAAVLIAAVTMTLPALLSTRDAFAGNPTVTPAVQLAVDCDTSTAGVQNACNIATANTGTIPIDVILSNFSGAGTLVASFNYDLYNDQCDDPDFGSCKAGNTTNAAGGIAPGFPVQDPVNFPANYNCNLNPAQDDTGNGAAGTSTSTLSCVKGAGASLSVANGASARISGEDFTDNVGADTTIVLTLSNVAVADDNAATTVKCDSASGPPPASPEGQVVGPCFPATLCFLPGGVGTCAAVATPVPTATPAPPTATATPCSPNCPTPTSLAFVTITPNAATLTAAAGTAVPATAVPPPPGGEQPGGAPPPPPTGNQPGAGAGAGGTGPITLPDTGGGGDGGIDWTALSLLALVVVAVGGVAGGIYLGAVHVSASRGGRGDD